MTSDKKKIANKKYKRKAKDCDISFLGEVVAKSIQKSNGTLFCRLNEIWLNNGYINDNPTRRICKNTAYKTIVVWYRWNLKMAWQMDFQVLLPPHDLTSWSSHYSVIFSF